MLDSYVNQVWKIHGYRHDVEKINDVLFTKLVGHLEIDWQISSFPDDGVLELRYADDSAVDPVRVKQMIFEVVDECKIDSVRIVRFIEEVVCGK